MRCQVSQVSAGDGSPAATRERETHNLGRLLGSVHAVKDRCGRERTAYSEDGRTPASRCTAHASDG